MKALMNFCIFGMLTLVVSSGYALAQAATSAEARLKELNIALPPLRPPVANYVDSVRVGNLLFLSGNTAAPDWKYKGKVGKDLTVQEGYDTARQVGLIMLAKVRAALGSLDHVKRIVKVLGMVNSAEGFGDQPKVINGFSDFDGGRLRRGDWKARTLRRRDGGASVQQCRGGRDGRRGRVIPSAMAVLGQKMPEAATDQTYSSTSSAVASNIVVVNSARAGTRRSALDHQWALHVSRHRGRCSCAVDAHKACRDVCQGRTAE
jgi:enamine deaminase RidA (YjgF/YER057c/UK114 family)